MGPLRARLPARVLLVSLQQQHSPVVPCPQCSSMPRGLSEHGCRGSRCQRDERFVRPQADPLTQGKQQAARSQRLLCVVWCEPRACAMGRQVCCSALQRTPIFPCLTWTAGKGRRLGSGAGSRLRPAASAGPAARRAAPPARPSSAAAARAPCGAAAQPHQDPTSDLSLHGPCRSTRASPASALQAQRSTNSSDPTDESHTSASRLQGMLRAPPADCRDALGAICQMKQLTFMCPTRVSICSGCNHRRRQHDSRAGIA